MFSDEELKKVINYESIGSFFPYQGGTDDEIENYIKTIFADLNRSSLITVEADYSMYGSGYASYVDLFCYKKDGSSTTQKGSVYYINEANLTTYITEWNDKKDIIHQVKAMSEVLGYQYGINHLLVPLLIDAKSDEFFIFEPMPETNSTKITKLTKPQ